MHIKNGRTVRRRNPARACSPAAKVDPPLAMLTALAERTGVPRYLQA
ncbi:MULTISPECIES: hypothetical protein [Streptomyces]|uniref:Uncharacterized protein n=1 Tax=Streptomyces chengmaiensis TaxID=3040919 RepID=A0ABT6HWK9_9ACTN|nr:MULTISPECIES: hypothetical protein [Streptomyces]MDH2392717.1 hypothetical protein [Streptomyces chengmaiensis]WRQ83015.1 hypothetical protein I3F59_028735 [Streptomyces sp. MUM 178J]